MKLRMLASLFERRQLCFELNTFMIIKENIIVNELASLIKSLNL